MGAKESAKSRWLQPKTRNVRLCLNPSYDASPIRCRAQETGRRVHIATPTLSEKAREQKGDDESHCV